jgi:hypothetical protein
LSEANNVINAATPRDPWIECAPLLQLPALRGAP